MTGDGGLGASRIVIESVAEKSSLPTDKRCMCECRNTQRRPRRRSPASAYVILTAMQERSLGCARDDDTGKGYPKKV